MSILIDCHKAEKGKCENGKIFCCSFALDSVLTFSLRAKRGCTWPQGRLAIKHSLLYSGDETRLSPSSISVLFPPLFLNALCNILIKKFLQSLQAFAGCWLIMRSHCARLNSTQLSCTQLDLVRWRIKAKEGTKGLSVPCDRLTIVNNNSSSSSST